MNTENGKGKWKWNGKGIFDIYTLLIHNNLVEVKIA